MVAVTPLVTRNIDAGIATGDALDVRDFCVHERMMGLFSIELVAYSRAHAIDFEAVIGKQAYFEIQTGGHEGCPPMRRYTGVISRIEQVRAEVDGYSTYALRLVPSLWLLTQRRNYRVYQQMSELAIVLSLLKEWKVEPIVRCRVESFKKRKYRVQYAESDFAFISRLLEDAGVSMWFEEHGGVTRLVLGSHPEDGEAREAPLPFNDEPSKKALFATAVRVVQRVRPGKYTIKDHDYRLPPDYDLKASVAQAKASIEERLEQYEYVPGAFLFGSEGGDATPSADDKGRARTDERIAAVLAKKRLEAKRALGKTFAFETNALDMSPGRVVTIVNHPRRDVEGRRLLVLETIFAGSMNGEWSVSCEAVSADAPYRPPIRTARPKVIGVESAVVVGPPGEEIHTDEFGRVRVQFHWDRDGRFDDSSSCWIHVSQPWAGGGFGGINLPRVGQEVLVDFLGGDPDRPVITGRVYTSLQKVPNKLPENKTRMICRSSSTGGSGGYNEIMMEDQAGNELLSMQAQRDAKTLVKRSADTTVGASRSTTVGGNDMKKVILVQTLSVGGERDVEIKGPTTLQADGSIIQISEEGSVTFDAKEYIASKAPEHQLDGKITEFIGQESILLKCGPSTIKITAEKITIDGPEVYLNPDK